jgi:hypothetical protein
MRLGIFLDRPLVPSSDMTSVCRRLSVLFDAIELTHHQHRSAGIRNMQCFAVARNHTSGSARDGLKFIDCKVQASCACQAGPLVFKPYKARTIKTVFPMFDGPNSGAAVVCTFSLATALRYAFPISIDFISISLRAAIRNAIRTLSLVTTVE